MLAFAQRLGECRKRVDGWHHGLQDTHIWYLYFTRKGAPQVRQTLRRWVPQEGPECFVAKGASTGWCYVYLQSTVAYLVRVHANGDVTILTETDAYERDTDPMFSKVGMANHGDHMTMGIDPMGTDTVVLKTHYTTYTEVMRPDMNYKRNEIQCNLRLLDDPQGVTGASVCIVPKVRAGTRPPTPPTLATVYHASQPLLAIVREMSRIALGVAESPQVHEGKMGGRYIYARGSKRRYLPRQHGGAPVHYKSFGFTHIGFVAYVTQHIVDPVFDARRDLEGVVLLYDERAQLGLDANRFLVFLYDFEDDFRHIFYVDARKALMAYYASTHTAEATAEERAAEASFESLASLAVSRLVTVGAT